MKLIRQLLLPRGPKAEGALLPNLRRLSVTVLVGLALAVAGLATAPALLAKDLKKNEHWVGTWSSGQRTQTAPVTFSNQTLRQIVRTSIGGDQARVRLTNALGTEPLVIGAAHIAVRDVDAGIVPGTDRVLTFGGAPSITIAAGAHVLSDPVDLDVPALGDLAIDIYLPGDIAATISPITSHTGALQTNYVSPPGDHTGAAVFPVMATTLSWYFLAGVDVTASKQTDAVITLGDSITDGSSSTPDTNNRWPNQLARRLLAQPGKHKMGVLNVGIGGNRVLTNEIGPNAQARFDSEVLVQSGVTHVIVLEGINDIGFPALPPEILPLLPLGTALTNVSAVEIIAGHKQLIERAHARRLKIYGGTLLPFQGAFYWTPEGEAKRQAVNHWIRTSGAYDAVIDFDAAIRDPSDPLRMLPLYDSGDHLHPGDAGYRAMGDAIDLKLFKRGEGH